MKTVAAVAMFALVILNAAPYCGQTAVPNSDKVFAKAFEKHQDHLEVEGEGTVSRVLDDDAVGIRHQRFIVSLASGQTLLIAHNIDVAPRVPGVKVEDRVSFKGEYSWNSQGGVIDWTHHDPGGKHPAGWILYKGTKYQ